MNNIRVFLRLMSNERFSLLTSWLNRTKNKSRRIMFHERLSPRCIEVSRTPILLMWGVSLWPRYDNDGGVNTKLAQNEQAKMVKLIKEADSLFQANKNREIIALLEDYKDSKDVEVLWRLVRAQYNLSQESTTTEAEKKSLIYEAYSLILEALEIDENHYATHKWMSVLLDARSAYDGLKARITQLERVKSHMLRAAELNPKDATTLYMIGSWCYQIADMPWFQRKIAATIFVAPPTSTYEEALSYFIKAEEVEPRFYSLNLLMLGKTYLKLKKEDQARYYLDLAKNYPVSSEEDQKTRKEASQLLSSLKPKQEKEAGEKPLQNSA